MVAEAAPPGGADPLDVPTSAVSRWVRLRRAKDLDLNDPADARFGDYELLERLGVGGMGAVYRARQLSLDRDVALKLIGVDAATGDELVARFHSEARHAGRLQHPNIVPVYEIGSHEDLYYFSMGLVRGPTLGQWRREDRDASTIATLLRTLAEAVQYAHGVGILHLDLKPGNVLLDERGQPQISDFGLARRIEEASHGGAWVAAGTPGYMAPEQAGGDPAALRPATDVWGLGAILYALLCGMPPVQVDDHGQARHWQVVPPRQLRPALAADLEAICLRCLQAEPADRYPSARALADDLQRFLDGRPVSVRRQAPGERLRGWMRREPRSAALAGALLAVLLGGLVATTALWWRSEHNRILAQTTLWDARRSAALGAAERGEALAGLPELVANVAEAEGLQRADDALADRLRIGQLLAHSPRQIARWEFADEGRSLAFAERGGLLLAGLRSGELVALDTHSENERWRIHPAFPPTPWGASFVGRIQPVAGGRHALLYPSGSSGVVRPDSSAMHRVHLASGTLDQPPSGWPADSLLSYSADGGQVLLRSPAQQLQLWSVDPWRPLGTEFSGDNWRYCLVLPRRPQLACASQGFTRVDLLDGNGLRQATVGFADGSELLSWAADPAGRWLALGSASGQLLLIDPEDGTPRRFHEAGEGGIADLVFNNGLLTLSYGGGSVRVLDAEAGEWASPRVRSGEPRVNAASFDPASGWLLANDGRVVVWRMTAIAERRWEAQSMHVLRHRGAVVGFQAAALDAGSGQLASHGSEGELKLFRLPAQTDDGGEAVLLPGVDSSRISPRELRVEPRLLRLGPHGTLPAQAISLPATPYLAEGSPDGRYWLLAADRGLLRVDPEGRVQPLALPASAAYLLAAEEAALVLVGWIADAGGLEIDWRLFDLAVGDWRGGAFRSAGLPAGLRLSADGGRFALWQGSQLQIRRSHDGRLLAALDSSPLAITDLAFRRDPTHWLLATSGRSVLLPASLEHWQEDGAGGARRLQRIDTPTAHSRVFDLGDAWLGHGARAALYRDGERHALTDIGAEAAEVAALSPDRRWAAFGSRDSVQLFDLARRQALAGPLWLPLSGDDALGELRFARDGRSLLAHSHFGRRLRFDFVADLRPLPALWQEADDLAPRDPPRPSDSPVQRRARDPGAPPPRSPASTGAAQVVTEAPAADGAIDLAPWATVPHRQRFQGSRRGLGISDSAAWPQGLLQLRGATYQLGPALQLAPAGQALGAARFPERSAAIPLPTGSRRLSLLLGNQQAPQPGGLQLIWLDARGEPLQQQALEVPTVYDAEIHNSDRGHQPRAEVALVLRSAESRQRGGGSPRLLVYRVQVSIPKGALAFVLHAPAATPLLLGANAR